MLGIVYMQYFVADVIYSVRVCTLYNLKGGENGNTEKYKGA